MDNLTTVDGLMLTKGLFDELNEQELSDVIVAEGCSAAVLDRYNREHNAHALWTVTKENVAAFIDEDGVSFSKTKYGDPDSIRDFASRIAKRMLQEHGEEMVRFPESFCILLPAHRSAPTAASLLGEAIRRIFLEEYGVDIEVNKMSRGRIAVSDFGKMREETDRKNFVVNDFFYDGPSLRDKTVLFIEDALVSGASYLETQRALDVVGLDLGAVHGYFITDIRAETFPEERLSIEGVLNRVWVHEGAFDRLIEIFEKEGTRTTPRMAKMFLECPWEEVEAGLSRLSPDKVVDLYRAIVDEELHVAEAYSHNACRFREYLFATLA